MELWNWLLIGGLFVVSNLIFFMRGVAFYRNDPERTERFLDRAHEWRYRQ